MIKKIWKLLTEDPGKPVSNPVDPEPKVEVKPEPKEEVHVVTLQEKIISLRNISQIGSLSPSRSMSDFQILNMNKTYDRRYDDMYGNSMYDRGYDRYDGSAYRTRNSYSDSYEVIILISGRIFFRDIYPMIVNGELRPALDYSSCGIMEIGEDEIEKSIVKDVTLTLTITEESRISPTDLRVSISVTKMAVRRTLSDQSGIKSRSNNYHQIPISRRLRSVGCDDIMRLITQMYPDIKSSVEDNFREEVKNTKEQIRINNTLKEFDDKINENSVKDCFAYAMDEVGEESSSVELMGVTDGNTIIKDMSNKYWRVNMNMGMKRDGNSGVTKMSINDKSLNMLFEINEGINKIKQIYDKCDITLNICDHGAIQIDIKPVIGIKLEHNNQNDCISIDGGIHHGVRGYANFREPNDYDYFQ